MPETTDSQLLVVDVPIAASAEDATRILNEPIARGFYLRSVTASQPMRAVFAKYAPADDDKCGEELRAMGLVVANRKEPVMRIVQILCEHDIYRGMQWVGKTVSELKP
jgi:hypothetical protein